MTRWRPPWLGTACMAMGMLMVTASLASAAAQVPPTTPQPRDVTAKVPLLGRGGEVELKWVDSATARHQVQAFIISRSLSRSEAKAARLEQRRLVYEHAYARLASEGVAPEEARTQAAIEAHRKVPTPADGEPPPEAALVVSVVPATEPGAEHRFMVDGLESDQNYRFMVVATAPDRIVGELPSATAPMRPRPGLFFGQRAYLLAWIVLVGGSVIAFILMARAGRPMRIRRIAALEAVDEAVGRATEMGRSVLFIPGIQDMDNVQTIAGITVLSRVAKTVAEYDAAIEVPTARSLTMQASREAVQASYMQAGRSESYNPDVINYITDEQFGFVAYVGGRMVREKPAACFYMGCFFAESLILAETGNSIGAIQIAGTAESSQLPFFVAACDYTLIGEEFFAASAYLSGEPDQIGSIKGQDVGKAVAILVILIGAGSLALAAVLPAGPWSAVSSFIRTILTS
ncbi:MAG: hypothetical protein KF724_11835 [Phycisphaeraceae bacterium]|nr:hypothetical protein [Phycisphaeraceae bacterium]